MLSSFQSKGIVGKDKLENKFRAPILTPPKFVIVSECNRSKSKTKFLKSNNSKLLGSRLFISPSHILLQ